MEQISESNKRLRLCVRWFQGIEESLILEQEKLRISLAAAENKCAEMDMERKNKEDELNAAIGELRQNCALLQEKLTKEESDKLDAIRSHNREKEARIVAENVQASLSEELEKTRQEKLTAEQKVSTFEDMYKRLQEYNTSLQQYNSRMQTDLATTTATLQQVEKEKVAILETLSTLRGHYSTVKDQLALSKASQDEAMKQKEALENDVKCLRAEMQQVRDDRDRHFSQVQALAAEIEKYKESTGKSVAELDRMMIKSSALEETCSSQKEQLQILQHQLVAANEKLKVADLSASETRTEFEDQKRVIGELKDRLADAELQISEGEKLRKKLHNTILELKGNIRVFCRVRPLLPEDDSSSESPVVSYPTSTEARDRGIDLIQSGQKYPFIFDKVFSHDASQNDVFVEISQLVQSALDGYKVCIFAYGQTGSGKTYTMMGRPESTEQKGLIPRSLEQIFQTSQSLSAQGWKYKMQASMLEIYNETIRDLLSTNRTSLDMIRVENGAPGKQYAIKHDANGNTYVSDLTIVDVCSIKEVSSLLHQAAQSRSVGKTQMNEQSSRSHFVFTLRISGVNESTEQQVQGVLNLIDLAGSERLSRSGATGDRLKETQAINKSLSCLADVIFALAKKEDHVPFRNSKLTYLLQPCLGGDSKTLMFVNVSPDPSSVGESLCSLRFAARVNSCEIGIPRRQTTTRTSDSRLSYG
ncbi:Kinesin-like protein KIN-14C [Ancistrocladus abbreviatus]